MASKVNSKLTDVAIKERMNPDEKFSFAYHGQKFAEFLCIHRMPFNDKGEYLWLGANLDYSRFAFFRGMNAQDDEGTISSFGNMQKNGAKWNIEKIVSTFGVPKQAVIGGIESRAKLNINIAEFIADEKNAENGEWLITGEEIIIFLVTKHSKSGAPSANIVIVELLKGMTAMDVNKLLSDAYANNTAYLGDKSYRMFTRIEWKEELKARKKAKNAKKTKVAATATNAQ
jgi:hypothetical protein